MYTQDFNPVSDSLGLSAIFAVLPVLTLFVLLGGLKMKAQWAALISLAVAMLVALIVYGMPIDQTALSASEGAVFGFFPIMWIVIMALWIYNMTVETGHFAVLRRSFGAISEDQRIQAVIIAFCFGALHGGARRLRHARRDQLGDADRPRLPARSRPPRSRSWRTRRRSRSARSRFRSSRCPRSPASTRVTSARWSVARRPSSP